MEPERLRETTGEGRLSTKDLDVGKYSSRLERLCRFWPSICWPGARGGAAGDEVSPEIPSRLRPSNLHPRETPFCARNPNVSLQTGQERVESV